MFLGKSDMMLDKVHAVRFKDAQNEYKKYESRVESGNATISEIEQYEKARRAFFEVCEQILRELLREEDS